jgi:two-component system phosphate regulon sensor histidine kinase PhoR
VRRRRLWQHLVSGFVLIVLLATVAAEWFAATTLREVLVRRELAGLTGQARLLARQVGDRLQGTDQNGLEALCQDLGKATGVRFTITDANGTALGDSVLPVDQVGDLSDRPEVREALAGQAGTATHPSKLLHKEMAYAAVPIYSAGRRVGVARASWSTEAVDEELGAVYRQIAFGGLIVAVLGVLLGSGLSRRLASPVRELQRNAERFAEGDLDSKVPSLGVAELDDVAASLNQMAARVAEERDRLASGRAEAQAILESMVEGVIAVDLEDHILATNRAAETFLAAGPGRAAGRTVQEVTRSPDLNRLLSESLNRDGATQAEIVMREPEERVLQATATPLNDQQGRIGTLVVLNDVTRLRRLERVRRDFVANVSHELKTPISAVRAAVETLQAGAMSSPEDRERFLGMVARHVERINAIIDDLLALARLEEDPERLKSALRPLAIRRVLEAATDDRVALATGAGVEVVLTCHDELTALIDPSLLQQAVSNLIDNAVRHSEAGTTVQVEAKQTPDRVEIAVRDQGCGIEERHLPRIFERFYRVDTARSRAAGGTGLGLSIVRHIARIHGGEVTVESAPGKGSTFTLRLPLPP